MKLYPSNGNKNKASGNRDIPITVSEDLKDDSNKTQKEESDKSENNVTEIKTSESESEDNLFTLEKERDDLKEKVLRIAAELDNMRRRSLKEKNELIDYANQRLLNNLLPLIDDFDKAIAACKQNTDCDSLLQGLELIYSKTVKTFEQEGVKKMEINTGNKFNVDFHEALLSMPSQDFENDAIIEVVQDGYMLRDKVLRHAKVITSSGQTEDK